MDTQLVFLSLMSAVLVAAEVITYKYLQNKYPQVNGDMVVWTYRMGSLLFLSAFIFWELYSNGSEYYKKAVETLEIKEIFWWLVLLSLCSALGIILYYRAVNRSKHPGMPTSIRSLYIPLTFLGATILITQDWKEISWATYLGNSLIVVAVALNIYGSTQIAV